ncbi:MAG: 50S ribosomal protein L5 [Candidatus Levybacteria bacterium]|nr:50S ribosomal protein L5 [Candidatus Levybacteria bacterium]
MNTLQQQYNEKIRNELKTALGAKNIMEVPQLKKIVVNMGVRDAVMDKKNIERATGVLATITGQKPRVAKARKSIAGFKLREGDAIGLTVTLRGDRMYAFFDKLVSIVLPRLRDFHGVKQTSFDPQGNYTLGMAEYAVFPEIDPAEGAEKMQGLEISLVTSAANKEGGYALLKALGMPFEH